MIFQVEEAVTYLHYVPAKDEDEARDIVEKHGSPARYEVGRAVTKVEALPKGEDE